MTDIEPMAASTDSGAIVISFVVIAYNEERNIARCLDGIRHQESQLALEVIVVNDGSTDDTLRVAEESVDQELQVHIIDLQPNRGRGAARAAGVRAAGGEFVAFVDADILLPPDWLNRCLEFLQDYDACGGVAVPDGDVAFVHRIFQLPPRLAAHSTDVSGGNGLFRGHVFDRVSFAEGKRNGEDVELGYEMVNAGFTVGVVPDLLVEHHETKTYGQSVAWLYESGVGASRQLRTHRRIRLPDLSFAGIIVVTLASLILSLALENVWWLGAVPAYLMVVSMIHLSTKFRLAAHPLASVGAVVTHLTLLGSYYVGRIRGLSGDDR